MMRRALVLSLLLVVASSAFAGTGRIIIVNNDKAGVGLNDTTPVEPVGGNTGRTLGEQRMIVYQAAAERWSAVLDTDVDIRALASFTPLECDNTSGVLGMASAIDFVHDFENAPKANVSYPIALANALAGRDLDPTESDINMRFNSDIDNPECLGASDWYYGLDGNHGTDIDLFVVVLHELAHGLGVSSDSGDHRLKDNRPSVFDVHTVDRSTGQRWDQMSEAQRQAAFTNTGNLVWDGPNVRTYISRFLQPVTTLTITAPSAIARNYDIGTAAFGPAANVAAMSGSVVRALDVTEPAAEDQKGNPIPAGTTFDGCSPFTNAAAIAGKVALIDRGRCTFVSKALNAQAAGAVGVVIVDNKRDTCMPVSMGGEGGDDVTIPIVSISARDGDLLKAQLTANATVSTMLRVDPSQLAGTSQEGYMRLYAPCTAEYGSSKHHWDVVSTPNLLMEPSVNGDVLHGLDLTLYQLLDIGWKEKPRSGRTVLRR